MAKEYLSFLINKMKNNNKKKSNGKLKNPQDVYNRISATGLTLIAAGLMVMTTLPKEPVSATADTKTAEALVSSEMAVLSHNDILKLSEEAIENANKILSSSPDNIKPLDFVDESFLASQFFVRNKYSYDRNAETENTNKKVGLCEINQNMLEQLNEWLDIHEIKSEYTLDDAMGEKTALEMATLIHTMNSYDYFGPDRDVYNELGVKYNETTHKALLYYAYREFGPYAYLKAINQKSGFANEIRNDDEIITMLEMERKSHRNLVY